MWGAWKCCALYDWQQCGGKGLQLRLAVWTLEKFRISRPQAKRDVCASGSLIGCEHSSSSLATLLRRGLTGKVRIEWASNDLSKSEAVAESVMPDQARGHSRGD